MTDGERAGLYIALIIDPPASTDDPLPVSLAPGDQVRLVPLRGNAHLDAFYARVIQMLPLVPPPVPDPLPANACSHGKHRQAWCGECQVDWLGIG